MTGRGKERSRRSFIRGLTAGGGSAVAGIAAGAALDAT
jgi:hypothetical protein